MLEGQPLTEGIALAGSNLVHVSAWLATSRCDRCKNAVDGRVHGHNIQRHRFIEREAVHGSAADTEHQGLHAGYAVNDTSVIIFRYRISSCPLHLGFNAG